MSKFVNYGEILENMEKEIVHSNHTIWRMKNNPFLTVNLVPGLSMAVEIGFKLEYGKVGRLKNGLAHLIEHLVSNKINEKVTKYDGIVNSRVSMDKLILGCSIPFIKSDYIDNSDIPLISDIIDILVKSIQESADIDYIKDNLENEINIIKNELMINEMNEDRRYDIRLWNYLTKERLCINNDNGGTFEGMGSLNDPQLVYDALIYVLNSDIKCTIKTPNEVYKDNYASWYNDLNEIRDNKEVVNENIFETEFKIYNDEDFYMHKNNDTGICQLDIRTTSESIKPLLLLNIPKVVDKKSYIDTYLLNGLMNVVLINDSESMVWKELRESGKTYGLFSEIHVWNSTRHNLGEVYQSMFGIELDNDQLYKDLFKLIEDGVYMKYVKSGFERGKRVFLKSLLYFSIYGSQLDGGLKIFNITIKELVDRLNEIKPCELVKFVEDVFNFDRSLLVVPVLRELDSE